MGCIQCTPCGRLLDGIAGFLSKRRQPNQGEIDRKECDEEGLADLSKPAPLVCPLTPIADSSPDAGRDAEPEIGDVAELDVAANNKRVARLLLKELRRLNACQRQLILQVANSPAPAAEPAQPSQPSPQSRTPRSPPPAALESPPPDRVPHTFNGFPAFAGTEGMTWQDAVKFVIATDASSSRAAASKALRNGCRKLRDSDNKLMRGALRNSWSYKMRLRLEANVKVDIAGRPLSSPVSESSATEDEAHSLPTTTPDSPSAPTKGSIFKRCKLSIKGRFRLSPSDQSPESGANVAPEKTDERKSVCKRRFAWRKKSGAKKTQHCHQDKPEKGLRGAVFGGRLEDLVDDQMKIPVVLDRLIVTLEAEGLDTEGIYRKPGLASKVKELKNLINTEPDVDKIDFNSFSVLVLAQVLKAFFRDMPEPLFTVQLYDEFLSVTDIKDNDDKLQFIKSSIKKLPTEHYEVLERLLFHLARISLHEECNKMSSKNLAIVFAPSVLKNNKPGSNALDSLQDVAKQAQCLEILITEKAREIKGTL